MYLDQQYSGFNIIYNHPHAMRNACIFLKKCQSKNIISYNDLDINHLHYQGLDDNVTAINIFTHGMTYIGNILDIVYI